MNDTTCIDCGDIDRCVHCGEPCPLAIELPSGDLLHFHCEEDYEQGQMEAWHERHRGAGYVAEGCE